jgi:hypothetical protein
VGQTRPLWRNTGKEIGVKRVCLGVQNAKIELNSGLAEALKPAISKRMRVARRNHNPGQSRFDETLRARRFLR